MGNIVLPPTGVASLSYPSLKLPGVALFMDKTFED